MIVGICHTKSESGAIAWTKAFRRGIELHGDRTIRIKNAGDLSKLAGCDISFQVCEACYNHGEESRFRSRVKRFQVTHQKPRIILDVGFIKNTRKHSLSEQYVSIGLGGIKRIGAVHTKNSPSDRWEKLNISKPNWRVDGNHILVLGQYEKGIGTMLIREKGLSFLDWSNNILLDIRKYTNRHIIYKPHPGQQKLPSPVKRCDCLPLRGKSKISKHLSDCWCAVALASNGAVDCVMGGVPVITNDKMSIVYDISSHSISEIENPKMSDTTQWLHDISYAQWKIEELRSGETWEYIKNQL